jgi:hypothetical protein
MPCGSSRWIDSPAWYIVQTPIEAISFASLSLPFATSNKATIVPLEAGTGKKPLNAQVEEFILLC